MRGDRSEALSDYESEAARQGQVGREEGSDCNARRADYKLADKYDDGGDD